jgi:hypothetical protein
MWWLLLTIPSFAFSQELDLQPIEELERILPATQYVEIEEIEQRIHQQRYSPPKKKVSEAQIKASGIEYGHIAKGTRLFGIGAAEAKVHETAESIYAKFHRMPDEQGFKYVINNEGEISYKIRIEEFISVQQDLALYRPPHRYSPAPVNVSKSKYDQKFKFLPEAVFQAGIVQGNYMRDLFNDPAAARGYTTQYALHFASHWDLPLKMGGVVNYERATYNLTGGSVNYSSLSIGPQFKSKDFDLDGFGLRFQMQYRVSPLAKAEARTAEGDLTFKFNSADLLISAEHPRKNEWGHMIFSLFFQNQWLNIKEQSVAVNIRATNETNRTIGLGLAQVFE